MPKLKVRVLVVEDEPSVRMVLTEALEDAGFEIMEACDGTEALKLIQDPGGMQIVVTDINMPGLNGFDVANQARALYPSLPVIFVSALIHQASERNMASPCRWLTKPFRIDVLVGTVREMLAV